MLLIAVCLFASVYTARGMRTVYYRDGQVCDVCTENQGVVPYKQSYTPEEAGKRVIYDGQVNSRPISSTSYTNNRADYSPRNLLLFISLFYSSFVFPSIFIVVVVDVAVIFVILTTSLHFSSFIKPHICKTNKR